MNFFTSVRESLKDNENNEEIANVINRFTGHINLSDFDNNIKLIIMLIEYSVDPVKKIINETMLRQRAKLINTYIIRDWLPFYLLLLHRIVSHCSIVLNLPLNTIDNIIEILQMENVITLFIRSHWTCARTISDDSHDIITERLTSIQKCLDFLAKTDFDDEEEN